MNNGCRFPNDPPPTQHEGLKRFDAAMLVATTLLVAALFATVLSEALAVSAPASDAAEPIATNHRGEGAAPPG